MRLAVVDVKESDPKKVGECKTFQLPITNTHFVGREEALAEVVRQLDQANGSIIGQSISGIGGVGKTQLALHYAQAAANGEAVCGQYLGYDYVVWLNAELFLEGQFQAMAELWTGEHLKADEAIEAVYRYLKGKRALLVFDNAENARSIAAFLPPSQYASPVHLVITSRSSEWGEIPTVKLGGFSLEEAQEYVGYHLGPQSKEAVGKLVELLGGLPLAMSQAVSYIKAGHSTLEGFEGQFYLNQASLLSHELLEEEDHPKTVGTTLTLCLAQAKVKSSLVEKLLGVIAYFAAEGIKVELLQEGVESSKEEVDEALEVLESYSLVSRGVGELQVHRLVQEVMRHRHKFLTEPHTYWNRGVELLSGVVFDDDTNIEGMKQCSHAVAHVKKLSDLRKKVDLSREEELALGVLLYVSGWHQETTGSYEVARALQEQVLEIRERHYSRDHAEVAIALVSLGAAYGDLGNAHKQKELLERALIINERHYGRDHVQVARTLVNLSNAYGALGDWQSQKELLERALVIDEKHYGKDHAEVARTLANLGNAYGALGDAHKKKALLERALVIDERHYGRDHAEVALKLLNLGNAYGALGDAHKRKELLERALLINERHFGPDHIKVAKTSVSLGVAYGALGDAQKKKELLERALVIEERHFGKDHLEVAIALGHLGNACGALGDYRKRKELLERALLIEEQHYGRDNSMVAFTLTNLGTTYRDLGDALKAKELLERALLINDLYLGSDHTQVAVTLVNLGNAYGDLGNFLKMKKLLERALVINERHYGPEHAEVAGTLVNLGDACRELGDASKAKDLLERALAINERHYGYDHAYVAKTLVNLGIAYGGLGNVLKKKQLLERALTINERHYGLDHPEVAIALFNLAHASLYLGELSAAKSYAQKAYLLFRKYYGESHQYTQGVRELLQKCEEQMFTDDSQVEQYSLEVQAQSLRGAGGIVRSVFQPIDTDLEMVEIIVKWVKAFEQHIESWEVESFNKSSASIFVGMALEMMKTGQWEQFLEKPSSYGIPHEAVAELAEHNEVPRILAHIDRYSQLLEEVSATLLEGDGVEGLSNRISMFKSDQVSFYGERLDGRMPELIGDDNRIEQVFDRQSANEVTAIKMTQERPQNSANSVTSSMEQLQANKFKKL